MASSTIKLTGWKAVAALVVAGVAVGFWMLAQARTLETDARAVVRDHLAVGYQRIYMDSLPAGTDATDVDAEEILRRSEVEIERISARGRGDDVVVRVDVKVAGGPPPDGRTRRYFRMSYSVVTGWRIEREVAALAYYLTL